MNLLDQKYNRRERLVLVFFAFLLAIFYDILFWKQEIGLNFLIFVLFYLVVFVIISAVHKQLHGYKALFLVIPILIINFDVVIYNNFAVRFWAPFTVSVLLLLFSILITLINPSKHPFSFSSIPIFKNFNLGFNKWATIYNDIFRGKWNNKPISEVYKKLIIGFFIAVPLLLIFTALFSKADAVFLNWLLNIFDWHLKINLSQFAEVIWRITRTIFFVFFFGGIFHVLFSEEHKLGPLVKRFIYRLDSTIISAVLFFINSLFLIFVFIQFKYLFGSAEFVFENGLTFAEYARRGFFELVWVVIFVLILTLIIFRTHGHYKLSGLVKFFKVLLIVQTLIIAVSALKRMNLYQAEYGYTILRLYVEWFIYFLMIILASAVFVLIFNQTFRRLFYSTLIIGLIFLTVIFSINVDGMIAKKNVGRYLLEGKKIDLIYLSRLGTDAVPEVVRVLYEMVNNKNINTSLIELPSWTCKSAENYANRTFQIDMTCYIEHLQERIENLSTHHDSWREFNFAVFKAVNTLDKLPVYSQTLNN